MTITRRAEGDRNAAGEAAETWAATSNGTDISLHIQPLSATERSTLRQANPGQLLRGSHLVFLEKGTDIESGDRLYNSVTGNYYVVESVEEWPTGHIEVIAGITDRQ